MVLCARYYLKLCDNAPFNLLHVEADFSLQIILMLYWILVTLKLRVPFIRFWFLFSNLLRAIGQILTA